MRAPVVVVTALVVAAFVLALHRSRSSLLEAAPVAAHGGGPVARLEGSLDPVRRPNETWPNETWPNENTRRAARAPAGAAEVDVAGPAATARPGHLGLLVLEHGTRRPLPEVGLEVWVYREEGATTSELAVGADGRAFLAARELRDATGLEFVLDDPELGPGHTFRPQRSIDELLLAGAPLEILVPRGEWRGFQVLDAQGTPLAGATLEAGRLRPAVTGADGRGRVRMTAPALRHVNVWAPGHRVAFVAVPREEEAWIIRLGRASRLEFVLVGCDDVRGYHVELRLPATMRQRTFHQSRYVQTPGRPRDGTAGRWTQESYRGPSRWSLGFGPAGRAVVDQLYDAGMVEVELRRFDEPLATRALVLPAEGGTQRVEFEPGAPPPELAGRVVDLAGRPVAGAAVRMAPLGGRATIDLSGFPGFAVWAPEVATDAAGEFRLPAARNGATVVVFSKRGLADRALTLAEIMALDGRVELEPGRAVVVEVRGRDGEPLDGGYSTGMAYLHVRPSVHLGHDVWRDVSRSNHPAAQGHDELGVPRFLFADLPAGLVRFRFTYLADDEVLLHDTGCPEALFVSRSAVDELGIGK